VREPRRASRPRLPCRCGACAPAPPRRFASGRLRVDSRISPEHQVPAKSQGLFASGRSSRSAHSPRAAKAPTSAFVPRKTLTRGRGTRPHRSRVPAPRQTAGSSCVARGNGRRRPDVSALNVRFRSWCVRYFSRCARAPSRASGRYVLAGWSSLAFPVYDTVAQISASLPGEAPRLCRGYLPPFPAARAPAATGCSVARGLGNPTAPVNDALSARRSLPSANVALCSGARRV